MRGTLRKWALRTLHPKHIQFIRKEILPHQRTLKKLIYALKKPKVFNEASSCPHSAMAHMGKGDLLYKLGQLDEAIGFYEKAIEIQPDLFRAHLQLELLIRLNGAEVKKDSQGNLLFDHVSYDLKQPALDKLVACCQKMVEIFPDSQEANFRLGNALLAAQGSHDKAIYYFHQANKLKFKQARAKGNKGLIFMSSLPRSGSGYVERSLKNGLGLDFGDDIFANSGCYPDEVISLPLFALSLEPIADAVICRHIPPSRANLMSLNLSVDKMLVQVRDPRQGLVSFVHYLRYLRRTNNIYALLEYALPENYFLLSMEDQINWQVEHYFLPIAINWINGWVDAQTDHTFYPKILFITHENLVADHQGFFEAILEFYEIDQSRFKFPEKPVFEKNTHMREGRVDEFKEAMTPKQMEKASRMIPERLKNMFGWNDRNHQG